MSDKIVDWFKNNKLTCTVVGVGLGGILLFMLPYLILGENSYLLIWDNLDSEILFNKINAKRFFNFKGTVPELMDIDIMAVNSFSVFQLPFYAIFPTFWAYIINDIIVRITAYFGMYLALEILLRNKYRFINIMVSLLYACLPFFTIYGLTGAGMPLAFWALYKIYRKEKLIRAYIAVAFYTIASSLILIGYFVIALLIITCIVFACRKQTRKTQFHFYIATVVMIALYVLCNLKMIILIFSDYESHRVVWDLSYIKIDLINDIKTLVPLTLSKFLGSDHVYLGLHFNILIPLLCVTVFWIGTIARIKDKNPNSNYYWRLLGILLAINLLLSFLTVLTATTLILKIINFLIGPSFSIHRFYYLMPFISFTATATSLVLVSHWVRQFFQERVALITSSVIILLVCVSSFLVSHSVKYIAYGMEEATYFTNVSYILTGKQPTQVPTYKQFYDEKLFSMVDEYIARPKSEYKVASLGIFPAISSYNGFHTIDGHSQFYSYEHWKKFRKIIAPEIEKADSMSDWPGKKVLYPSGAATWFNWGNQCYLFSSESDKFLYPKRDAEQIENLDLNIEAFTAMGGEYIFSTVKVLNHIDLGLIEHGPFEHDKSFYRIYLYEVEKK